MADRSFNRTVWPQNLTVKEKLARSSDQQAAHHKAVGDPYPVSPPNSAPRAC